MCSNPVTLFRDGRSRVIPCGNCLACRIDKTALWSARCNSELVKGRSAFVTLTYDDNHLPFNSENGKVALLPTVRKSDFQHFLDNLYHKIQKKNFFQKVQEKIIPFLVVVNMVILLSVLICIFYFLD